MGPDAATLARGLEWHHVRWLQISIGGSSSAHMAGASPESKTSNLR
jgi:hypothetical protein